MMDYSFDGFWQPQVLSFLTSTSNFSAMLVAFKKFADSQFDNVRCFRNVGCFRCKELHLVVE